ncbi:MAG: HAMP domain-containing histidine kinase [Rhodospirillales bacterium]|nr:HAMP domain-containing histidine kinase [Rhodospirillales bacterium]
MTPDEGADRTREGALEEFAAQVAHDFNNLLTGVMGNLELLQLRAARTGAFGLDAYIEGANTSSTRAVEFAQRLLVYSGRMAQAPEAVLVTALLREIAATPEGQGLELSLPEDTLEVLADPAELRLAILELLRNAREAMQEGGSFPMLGAKAEGGWVTIIVRDDGPGMTPEVQVQALKLLFSTRPNGAGRGLGLAIAARVAASVGGRLELDSAPGEGCEARLYLPMA